MESAFKEKNLLFLEQILFIKKWPHWEGTKNEDGRVGSQELYTFMLSWIELMMQSFGTWNLFHMHLKLQPNFIFPTHSLPAHTHLSPFNCWMLTCCLSMGLDQLAKLIVFRLDFWHKFKQKWLKLYMGIKFDCNVK